MHFKIIQKNNFLGNEIIFFNQKIMYSSSLIFFTAILYCVNGAAFIKSESNAGAQTNNDETIPQTKQKNLALKNDQLGNIFSGVLIDLRSF